MEVTGGNFAECLCVNQICSFYSEIVGQVEIMFYIVVINSMAQIMELDFY